jgi:hypothetical protein
MTGHNAFEMLLFPLMLWTTVIYLAMAAVHTLLALILKLVRSFPNPKSAKQGSPRPIAIAGLRAHPAAFRFAPMPVGPRS